MVPTITSNLATAQAGAFLESLNSVDDRSTSRILDWLNNRERAHQFQVREIPFSTLSAWRFEPETGDLVHKSGKFFRIEGIEVRTNFGNTPRWMQPIINQPEIGILGFLTKKIDGVLRFLVQAKMEPGNINLLQISPTVQATRSNYTQVHGGSRPAYLEYFLNRGRSRILADQLQSEQGSRFFRKRNRNVIIEIPEREDVQVQEDFRWLTLGELMALLRIDNVVNMDSRTVLSCIRFGIPGSKDGGSDRSFSEEVMLSASADEGLAENDFDTIVSWITQLKIDYQLDVRRVPLKDIEGWIRDDVQLRHQTGRFFSIIAVSVRASTREVMSWEQPLIRSVKGGVLCFVCQKRRGLLHFLVQGRVEPGNLDAVEMAPTLQCTPANYDRDRPELLPPFYHLVMHATPEQIRYSSVQSEEGGRFYHDQNRYLVVELQHDATVDLPSNFIWMTLRQIKDFIRLNNYFNIEARGLISCLPAL